MTKRTASIWAVASILGAWWLVALCAVDRAVHPMGRVVLGAAVWTAIVIYWRILGGLLDD